MLVLRGFPLTRNGHPTGRSVSRTERVVLAGLFYLGKFFLASSEKVHMLNTIIRQGLLVLLFILFAGCKGFPIRLEGQFEITDPTYEGILLISNKGEKRFYKENFPLKLHITGKRAISIERVSENQAKAEKWQLRFDSGSLEDLLNKDEVLLSAEETGQYYSLHIKRFHTFVKSEDRKKVIDCWFPSTKWVKNAEGHPLEKSIMEKNHQLAIVSMETYKEHYVIDFLDKGQKRSRARILSRPSPVFKMKKVKELEACKRK